MLLLLIDASALSTRGRPDICCSSTIRWRTLQLLHESHATLVMVLVRRSVSFRAALRMVTVLCAFTHLPLHAYQSRVVRIICEAGPLGMRLLKTCQVAHVGRCTAIPTRRTTMTRRLKVWRKCVRSRDVMWRWLAILMHEAKVWVRALSILLLGYL